MISDLATELSTELQHDEKLLWSGRPRQGILFRGSDVFLIPFSLLWGGFAIFWEIGVLTIPHRNSAGDTNAVAWFFPLFGLPFVAIGLYMMIGRFFVDSAQRRQTLYGITNQRVIIRSGLFSRNIKSLNLRTLSDVTLSERSDGKGTVTFGPSARMYSALYGMQWPGAGRQLPPCFDTIDDAKSVYEIVRRAQSSA